MDINHVLNALLMALSLATVFVTLMSFLIFKIRQFPKKSGKIDQSLEGNYFRRYDPFALQPEKAPSKIAPEQPGRWQFGMKAPAFFAGLTAVIFASLYIQNQAGNTQTRAALAHEKAEVDQLKAKGLAQKMELNPSLKSSKINEFIDPRLKEVLAADLKKLKSKHVFVGLLPASELSASPDHLTAVRSWEAFLKDMQIPFKSGELKALPAETEILILPEFQKVTSETRKQIESAAHNSVNFLATGGIGMAPESSKDGELSAWSENIFGVHFTRNKNESRAFPTMFATDRPPYSAVPSGLMLSWLPSDNRFVANATATGQAVAFEVSHNGVLQYNDGLVPSARSIFSEVPGRARSFWMAADPENLEKMTEAEQFYLRSFLVNSLKWLSQEPSATLANWSQGAKVAFLPSVDSEDQFEGASRLMELFKKQKAPATFFIVSDLLVKEPSLASLADDTMDLASHTTDHTILEGANLALQFEKIDGARLAIEKIAKRKVLGFRPPEERFDENTLNASQQNQVQYFFGDQTMYRFSPLFVAGGELVYYPRSIYDDFNLADPKIVAPDKILQTMKDEYAKVQYFGGAYFLSTHSQVFGKTTFLPLVDNFLTFVNAQDVWKTNYAEMMKWWKGRLGVRSDISRISDHHYRLKLNNTGAEDMHDLVFFLDSMSGQTLQPETPGTRYSVAPGNENSFRLLIPRLKAHEELVFQLETRTERVPSSDAPSPPVSPSTGPKPSTATIQPEASQPAAGTHLGTGNRPTK